MKHYFQEATSFTFGNNLSANKMRLQLPAQKKDASIFLLSDSYEYDIELIKHMPAPKSDYKDIIIPSNINEKIGIKQFRFNVNSNDYNKKLMYLNAQNILPRLTNIKPPYPKTITDNIYIPMSEVILAMTQHIRSFSIEYIQSNIFDIFSKIMNIFNFSKQKVLIIDTKRFGIYQNPIRSTFKTDVINALLSAYILNNRDMIKPLPIIIIFRSPDADYRLDLSLLNNNDIIQLKSVINEIGKPMEMSATSNEEAGDSIDSFSTENDGDTDDDDSSDSLDDVDIEDGEIVGVKESNKSTADSVKSSIELLAAKYGKTNHLNDNISTPNSLYNAKTLNINAELIHRITPDSDSISNYKKLTEELINSSDNPVEEKLIKDASKKIEKDASPINATNVMNTTTSARELKIRTQIGQLKLNNVTFNKLTSITDIPKPAPLTPLKITTTNRGSVRGSSFANISKAYEDNLMDRDIVATFMNLSKLPDGFYVTNVEVTDVSTITSLTNNWKVTLKNKQSGMQSIINIRVPRVMNGRFYNNGIWYNIGKQDFPIPILKINKKKVILTSNYNKITVNRYDTRSLVDLSIMMKTIESATDESGRNKYVKNGSSTSANSRFVSTIEYDEYARKWFSYINTDSACEIYFNRQQCLKSYTFVNVQNNEFCCGMINKVPIVINTETGLTRDGITLTDVIFNTLPDELKGTYKKIKPGKLSMYSEITIGVTVPLGVAITAWEGLSTILKKAGCKYQFVDSSFDDTGYLRIPFKDKTLAIANTIANQLIFNGFYRINTKAFNVSDFDIPIMNTNSVFVDIFNQQFFKQYSQLTTFITYYNFFVDAITEDVCSHYNIPNDITGMLIYASNLLADNNYTNENASSLYRIRSSEIIPAIIHYRLAVAISRYNNNIGSKTRGNSLAFNPNEVINELLAVPNVEPSSALNPMVELHSKENITKKGFKGVNDDRAYSLDKRTYDSTMIGKMAISSPNNGTVGITRQLVADPKIESVRGYTSTDGIETDFNDLQLASFSELLTPGTVTRDDAIRTAVATSQTSHILSTDGAEPTIVSNGVDEIVPTYLSDEFAVTAQDDGTVLEIADGYMVVQYKNGKKQAINVDNKYSFNTGSGFYVNNRLQSNFEVNDKFKKNDILAYHEKFFHKDSAGLVRMNIGPMAKIAFTGIYSTYEDAGIITTKMSKLLKTNLTMMESMKIDVTDDIESIVKVGDEVEINDPLIVFGLGNTGDTSVDNFLKAFQNNTDKSNNNNIINAAKRIMKAKHAGTVVDVRMYTVKSMDKLSPSLFKLFEDYFNTNKRKRKILDKYDKSDSVYKLDTLYSLPTEPLKGSTIKGITCDILIEIYIEHSDEASTGDKAVAYGASKQIISEVIPEGLEPYAEGKPEEEISMFVAPASIFKRMIPSVMITASANKVLIETKNKMRKIWESK